MNKLYIENIFRKINFDKLYIGLVRYFIINDDLTRTEVEYIGIAEKCGDGFYQVDNGLLLISRNDYTFDSTFPGIVHPIKLSDFYRACYGNENPFLFSHNIFPSTLNKVKNDAKKKVLVI